MKVSAFLKMCRKRELIPHSLNIESLQQLIRQVITPLEEPEYVYLVEKKMLLEVYNRDNNLDSHCEPQEGEPGLYFHEFIFLLALIALNAESLAEVPVPHQQIERFFVEKLGFIPDNTPLHERKYKSFDQYLEKA